MGEVKVSVIVPVYNTGAYLEQCLSGIQGQTLKEIEIICVDDGSSDNSVEQIKKLESEDARLCLLTQKNRGGGAARNAGMRHAKGKYLVFLDSDDYFHPEMLEKMYLRCERMLLRFVCAKQNVTMRIWGLRRRSRRLCGRSFCQRAGFLIGKTCRKPFLMRFITGRGIRCFCVLL